MKALEHAEQVSLMKWWAMSCHRFGIAEQLLFAIPNGGHRDAVTGAMLKAEGVRAGVPDLFLAVPKHPRHGLFIEMKKAKGGRVSDRQNEMISRLEACGYACCVCHGWIEAAQAIEYYMKGNTDYV